MKRTREAEGAGTVVLDGEGSGDARDRQPKRLVLTERDWEILRWAEEQKFLLFDQVARWFEPSSDENPRAAVEDEARAGFPRGNSSYAEKRIRTLCQFGVLTRVPVYTQRAPAVLPGRLGHDLLLGHGLVQGLKRQDGIDWKNFAHDREVTDLRWVFEKFLRATDWRSERVLRKALGSRLVPDAIVTLGEGRRLALELELTRKGVLRYLEIFRRYLSLSDPPLDGVLYVVPDGRDLAFLFNEVLPAALSKPDLWVADRPDLSLFRFTTVAAVRERRAWWTSSSPSSPESGPL